MKWEHLNREEMVHAIASTGEELARMKQVLERSKKLLPTRMTTLQKRYRLQAGATKALRLALQDDEYQHYVSEIVTLSAEIREHRVRLDVLRMVFTTRFHNSFRR